jgi:hypothetical protein
MHCTLDSVFPQWIVALQVKLLIGLAIDCGTPELAAVALSKGKALSSDAVVTGVHHEITPYSFFFALYDITIALLKIKIVCCLSVKSITYIILYF